MFDGLARHADDTRRRPPSAAEPGLRLLLDAAFLVPVGARATPSARPCARQAERLAPHGLPRRADRALARVQLRGRRDEGGRAPSTLLEDADATLLELVDHVLNKGVVVTGDVMLSIANVDLIYLRLSALLCAADRIFPSERKR